MEKIKLKLTRHKPTIDDLVQPYPSAATEQALRVVYKDAQKQQNRLLKKANSIK